MAARFHIVEEVTRSPLEAILAKRIILFGSQARGDGAPHSDFDIMVLEEKPADRFAEMAAQDEALLDAVIDSDKVSDEVISFHCQQAAEKMLKALLSDLGAAFRKTREPGALNGCVGTIRRTAPGSFENPDMLTPFGALRAWVEDHVRSRSVPEAT